MLKLYFIIPFLLFAKMVAAQAWVDPWVSSQLDRIIWHGSFKGVLADYHPVTIELASDHKMIVGYLIHHGDQRKHRLIGDWNKSDRFLLQERDDYDRLTGYLTGTITNDQVQLDWMSADQSRLFSIKAFSEHLIRAKNFKPVSEWIEISVTPKLMISVQKMDFGIVSGIARRGRQFSRFEGYCLDGTCSIWNTVLQNPAGAPIRVQMRQKDATSYKATINGVDYAATIRSSTPLTLRQFDNSFGFLDFVSPKFESKTFAPWLSRWIDKSWKDGVDYLSSINQVEHPGRLVHRSSGWIEIIDEGETYVSGLVTYINPGLTRREAFVWLKKEDVFISQEELNHTPGDIKKASVLAMAGIPQDMDQEYRVWLEQVGYTFFIPTLSGVVMATEFSMFYGDDLRLISLEASQAMVKKKYWKYFGW